LGGCPCFALGIEGRFLRKVGLAHSGFRKALENLSRSVQQYGNTKMRECAGTAALARTNRRCSIFFGLNFLLELSR
jgi:hypothetical protein